MPSYRRVLIFLAFIACSTPAFSQQPQDPEVARQFYEQVALTLAETKANEIALDLLINAANTDTTFIKANYEAGQMHLITINKAFAKKYFLRVYRQDPNFRFDIEFWIGRACQYGQEFEEAIKYYNLYKQKLAGKPNYQGKDRVDPSLVDRHIYECQNGKEFVANPGNFAIVNVGREINSEFEDYGAVLNEAEDEIVFTSRRRDENLNQNVFDDNKPWEDIFISNKSGGKWTFAKNIGAPVGTPYHESTLALSADGNTLFIFRDEGNGDIYYSDLKDGKWTEPMPLPGIINSSYEEKSITISADEKTLYFSSNRPGGFGGLDIYKATKDSKGEWSNVKNLGAKINTELDDDGPFIDYDGVTLYFSSEGRKGMGGYDVFKSSYNPDKNEWSEPTNLGYPINTPDDDVFFVSSKDGKRAYYSSVREDGMGYTDIYVITIPEGLKNTTAETPKKQPEKPPVDTTAVAVNVPKEEPKKEEPKVEPKKEEPKVEPVKEQPKEEPKVEPKKEEPKVEPKKEEPKVEPKKEEPKVQPKKEEPKPEPKKTIPLKYVVTVVDAEGKGALNAKVKMVGAKDNVVVGLVDKGNGVYEFNVTSGKAKDYRLSVEREGYLFQNFTIKLEGAGTAEKTVNRTIELRKLSVNATSILRNLYFDFDKATFKTESYTELNKLEAMMQQNQNLVVEIGGHTDAVGTKEYNLFLSRKRAEAVKDYLTKKGVDTRRIKVVGYGKTRPLASNDDEDEGRELNRRVELKVLSN